MIESNIVKWVDIGDSMQFLDVYGKKRWVSFFNLIKVLLSFKKFSVFFYIILNILSFLQLFMLNLTNVVDSNDSAINIFNYVSTVLFPQNFITEATSYSIVVILNGLLTVITILCIVYLMISIKIEKFYVKLPISLLNLMSVVLLNYLIGPIIQISLMCSKCKSDNNHEYLVQPCWAMPHLLYVIISVVNLLFFLIFSVILSIYYNEIGSIKETKSLARINCNYEIYLNLSKIILFIFGYVVKQYGQDNETFKIIFQFVIFFNHVLIALYVYKHVLFFDQKIYNTIFYGWVFSAWFSLVILIKSLLGIKDTSIFIILGWLILYGIVYYLEEFKEEYLLTDFNIFEAKTLKEIELYIMKLFNLLTMRSIKTQTLLIGIIEKFKETTKGNDELKDKYFKLMNNNQLRKKFPSDAAVSVLSMIYIVYDHHLEKSMLKNDILLNYAFYLISKCKNTVYTVFLLSTIKAVAHKQLYLKFLLMEEIKTFQVNKLNKSNNKDSIKHIQLGSVILYNIYIDLFKLKIYESCSNQIEYFDLLRNNVTTPKTTENFLKIGEDILNYRKEILRIWDRIIELNPFNEDAYKDYTLYLRDIIQDDILHKNEIKRYNNFRNSKMGERTNTYHSLFNYNSSILLVDGYFNFGKILYCTPNFSQLYSFSGKEVLNLYADDLIPQLMREFHLEIIMNALKFSNVQMLFNEQREFLLRSKTGAINSVFIYNKSLPNLTLGLVFIANITKNPESAYIIITDKEFKISGLTDSFTQGANSAFQGFSIDKGIQTNHVGIMIPDLLLQLEYKEEVGFFISRDDDLKGTLYSVSPHRTLTEKMERVLERIRSNGRLISDPDAPKEDAMYEYEELLKEIKARSNVKFSIFYKILLRSFYGGNKYYRVYVSNDLITMNDNAKPQNQGDIKKNQKADAKVASNKPASDKINSQKQIKIKLNQFGSNDENAKLMLDQGEGIENREYKKEIEKERDSGNSSANNSSATKSSADSASFNKLKNGILDKKEVSAIRTMRYLSFCFGIGTILLVFFASQFSKNKFTNINSFLGQNLYFNHSKIAVSCVYLATLNLKFVKNEYYIDDDRCFYDCKDFYQNMLSECISDIKIEKENSTYFYDHFKKILNSQNQISLDLYDFNNKDQVNIDVDSHLNLLVVYGLSLKHGLDSYYNKDTGLKITDYNQLDVVSENILKQSLIYLNDEKVSGFNDVQKENILNSSEFNPVNLILIIELGLFIILIVAFIYYICNLLSLERYYLKKLIEFKNAPFEQYLKSLEEIKKKIKNDTGEEEEKLGGDLDPEFGGGSKRSKDGAGSKEDGSHKKKKKKDNKGKDKDDDEDRDKKKRAKSRKKNMKNYREDKINVMGKYFLKWNILFCIKVILILLLSVSYYLVVSLIDQSTQSNLNSFDSTTNSIEGVYKQSFMIYLNLKTELAKYINYEIKKKNAIKQLKSTKKVTIDDKEFSSENEVNKSYYKMSLQNSIETPKIGHLLMPLVNTDLNTAALSIQNLNKLYNINACDILFPNKDTAYRNNCDKFWSSILTKGMEQSITQMSVVVTSVLDDLISLNNRNKELDVVIRKNSEYNSYEIFVEWYMFRGYMETVKIFRQLDKDNLQSIYQTYETLMIGYMCFVIILFSLLLYFVYKSKSIFNNFMNFIGILPVKYLMENPDLYREILKLEQHIY